MKTKEQVTKEDMALELIAQACQLTGWGVFLSSDDKAVQYLVIGTSDGLEIAMARLNGELN